MAEFIGTTVQVVLFSGVALEGIVDAVSGPLLTLANARDCNTGTIYSQYVVDGRQIQDIDVIEDNESEPLAAPSAAHRHDLQAGTFNGNFSNAASSVPKPFVDPAILSFSRQPPKSNSVQSTPPIVQQSTKPVPTAAQPMRQASIVPHPPSRQGSLIHPPPPPEQSLYNRQTAPRRSSKTDAVKVIAPKIASRKTSLTNAPITGSAAQPTFFAEEPQNFSVPFTNLGIRDPAESSAFDETDDASFLQGGYQTKFSGKRGRRGKNRADSSGGSFGSIQPKVFLAKSQNRQQPGQKTQQNGEVSRNKRRHKYQQSMASGRDEDGWATEDVHDYKDQEFDFQLNLDRFDKKTVFRQIQAEDSTAIEDRLVSHNRLPKPLKASSSVRKNFKNTENVLNTYAAGTSLVDRENWDDNVFLKAAPEGPTSASEEEEAEISQGEVASGRSSRHALSRQSRRPQLLQKASTADRGGVSSNRSSGFGSGAGDRGSGAAEGKPNKPVLRLLPSNRPCPVVSPLQMLDVERISEVELGLTDDMMTENAGRGIAQVAIQAFGKRLHVGNHNALPVILVFAGNNKSGVRAVAAGRHLKNHHVRVLICVLGLEREDELTESFRRQISIFRNAGGRLARWEELSSNLKTLDSPPELIIDGLLGMHVAFEDLRIDDQATAFELVNFANKSKAQVLSIDIPTGIDGLNGEVAVLEETGLFHVRSRWVVSMGAPKIGIMHAIASGVGSAWSLFVVDIGIPNTAWRKYGTRRRHGVEFAAEWVAALEYCP